jgi:predicted RNase H-like HicB family nuclease
MRGLIGRDIALNRGPLMRVAVVKATFDEDAGVWYVESSDIEGLHVEGDTFETFRRNVADAAADLLEGDGTAEVHIEIIAHASIRARVAA